MVTKHIYLDDVRPTPEGWVGCRWPNEVIGLINKGGVEMIDLDHDLGDSREVERTGYDVLVWLEEKCNNDVTFIPPVIMIHTSNPSARQKMVLAARGIAKIRNERIEKA